MENEICRWQMDILEMLNIIYHYRVQMETVMRYHCKIIGEANLQSYSHPQHCWSYVTTRAILKGLWRTKSKSFFSVYKTLKFLKLSLTVMSFKISLDRLKKLWSNETSKKKSVVSKLERCSMSFNRATRYDAPTEWGATAHPQSGTLLTSKVTKLWH